MTSHPPQFNTCYFIGILRNVFQETSKPTAKIQHAFISAPFPDHLASCVVIKSAPRQSLDDLFICHSKLFIHEPLIQGLYFLVSFYPLGFLQLTNYFAPLFKLHGIFSKTHSPKSESHKLYKQCIKINSLKHL